MLQGIEAAVPDVEVHILDSCSHWVQQDYPDQVNDIIKEWLEKKGLPGVVLSD